MSDNVYFQKIVTYAQKMLDFKRVHNQILDILITIGQEVFASLQASGLISINEEKGDYMVNGWHTKVVHGYPANWICVE